MAVFSKPAVWINLGEADGVKPRTTFHVYYQRKGKPDVAGKPAAIEADDIKGTIKVTRVLEANLSECQILMERFDYLIKNGDPIKLTMSKPRQGEAYSIIGTIDLDGDGEDDRDLLKEVVTTAGGVIDNDVDAKGVLHVNGKIPAGDRPRMTSRTKFVVIGKIPEIAPDADPAEVATLQKIHDLRQELETRARELGVRVVSLSDFLTYLGYKSQAGLNRPKGNEPYRLKRE